MGDAWTPIHKGPVDNYIDICTNIRGSPQEFIPDFVQDIPTDMLRHFAVQFNVGLSSNLALLDFKKPQKTLFDRFSYLSAVRCVLEGCV